MQTFACRTPALKVLLIFYHIGLRLLCLLVAAFTDHRLRFRRPNPWPKSTTVTSCGDSDHLLSPRAALASPTSPAVILRELPPSDCLVSSVEMASFLIVACALVASALAGDIYGDGIGFGRRGVGYGKGYGYGDIGGFGGKGALGGAYGYDGIGAGKGYGVGNIGYGAYGRGGFGGYGKGGIGAGYGDFGYGGIGYGKGGLGGVYGGVGYGKGGFGAGEVSEPAMEVSDTERQVSELESPASDMAALALLAMARARGCIEIINRFF
ncbi:hypothetical protein RRG08_035068 [Elysia crispata]|uniref:Uncharacterized protein n=1 Tax=Elysia crispata TaxID=231223 RepID=A0AAE0ZSJ2_9GAST|nr:hypothetical protein RRG08_035068 [Elysia crispata]